MNHSLDFAGWRTLYASDLVGDSEGMTEALETLYRTAATDCSILITGETGTGKELFAKAAHRASGRRGQAFIPVNCAAIPDTLLETELFGHIKGAFTGAVNARAGRFVAAHGGTIFLDEIGDLPLSAQAKLLRVLEERVVSPVGSDSDFPVDVRIIAATHRDLEAMVAAGTFRADLYFRLAVVPIHLPALRERGDDLLVIADLCVQRSAKRIGREVEGLDASGRAALRAYAWPGNIRELAHLIERAVLLARRSILGEKDLAIPGQKAKFARGTETAMPAIVMPTTGFATGTLSGLEKHDVVGGGVGALVHDSSLDLRSALENLEKSMIDRALTKAGGNRTEAAALLGLNRTTLVEKLRKYAG